MSSTASKVFFPGLEQYAATKKFCNFLGEAVNYELKSEESRVELTVLMPAMVDTKMMAEAPKKLFCLWV